MRLSCPKYQSPNFFGNTEHGNFESKDTITYLDVPEDQGPAYYFFNDFILHEGHTLTTTKPCRGLYIYVCNETILDGTISMNYRGMYSPPEGEYIDGYTPLGMHDVIGKDFRTSISLPGINELALGSSLNTTSTTTSVSASNGKNGGCGGGASGMTGTSWGYTKFSTGGCAGVFGSGSGGGGGAGYAYGVNPCMGNGCSSPGYGASNYSGNGGNPSTSNGYIGTGGQGTVVYDYYSVNGSLTLQENTSNTVGTSGILYFITNHISKYTGTLISQGTVTGKSHSGTSSYAYSWGGGGPGGACGGGSITFIYKTKDNNVINFFNNVSGYTTTTASNVKSKSGDGTFRSYQIS